MNGSFYYRKGWAEGWKEAVKICGKACDVWWNLPEYRSWREKDGSERIDTYLRIEVRKDRIRISEEQLKMNPKW